MDRILARKLSFGHKCDGLEGESRGSMAQRERKPRTVKDIKLISGGRILENSRTVAEYSSPLCDIPGGVITMHVVVQPTPTEKGKKLPTDSKQNKCVCIIL